jgi:SAM-dependent methyltransferase
MRPMWCAFHRSMPEPLPSPVHRRADCRLCAGTDLELVLALTPTPPANAFVSPAERDQPQPVFPLDLFLCKSCFHLQMLDVVDPRLLFENYVYVSGTSPVFVRHFQDYAAELIGRYAPAPGSLALDIGSNDGTLLRFFKEAGLAVLGIDPARSIAEAATQAGIETTVGFFTPDLAARLREERGAAAIVTANNVFAHIDDLSGVVRGVRSLLAADGVFAFEVSYLVDVVEKTLFDTIYHEHLSYHSVRPLIRFFAANGMELIEAQRIPTHGGSLRGIAQLRGGPWKVGSSVADALAVEARLGLEKAESFRAFGRDIDRIKAELRRLLHGFKAAGKSIAGFGAPAKATTLMYHFDIGPKIVDFIVDDSPLKQGLLTPGMHIPVLGSSALAERHPDYLIVLAWNFAQSIVAKHGAYRAAGGHFVVPLPAIELI